MGNLSNANLFELRSHRMLEIAFLQKIQGNRSESPASELKVSPKQGNDQVSHVFFCVSFIYSRFRSSWLRSGWFEEVNFSVIAYRKKIFLIYSAIISWKNPHFFCDYYFWCFFFKVIVNVRISFGRYTKKTQAYSKKKRLNLSHIRYSLSSSEVPRLL